jgi:signal transduction histidine kinase
MGDEAKVESEEDGDFASRIEHDSGVILRAAEQLHDIIEDLLSTGRTLGVEEARGNLDLAAAVADVVHWHRTPARANDVTLVSTIEPGVTVLARASGLRQVLTNLIGNAIIHNPRGGKVEISAERSLDEARDHRVRISVRDSGRGLSSDELARVFEPFVRFADRGVKGTGLGLPLARAVAERDGGLVGAESTPGEGSVFWVDLPALSADPA